jgi:hypothetical protein
MDSKRKDLHYDARTVDIADDYAVYYLTVELNTTKEKLLAAVTEVGTSLEALKRKLKK